MPTRTSPARTILRTGHNKYTYLATADLFAVVSIIGLHFLSPQSNEGTIAAMAAVVAAGLFLVIPLVLDSRRSRSDAMAALEVMRNDVADNQRSIHDAIRTLSETLARYSAATEKSTSTQTDAPKQGIPPALIDSILARFDALASRILTENRNLDLQPVLDDIASRLDECIEANLRLEARLEQYQHDAHTAALVDPDGTLPPSLVAKAFSTSQTSGNAIARIIENGAPAKTTKPSNAPDPDAKLMHGTTENRQPIEDEIWTAAADMANAEANEPDDDDSPAALFPKTFPEPLDEAQHNFEFAPPAEPQGTPDNMKVPSLEESDITFPSTKPTEENNNTKSIDTTEKDDAQEDEFLLSQPDIASGTELLDSGIELSTELDSTPKANLEEDAELEEHPEADNELARDNKIRLAPNPAEQDALVPLQFDLLDSFDFQHPEAPRKPRRTTTENACVLIINLPRSVGGMPYLRGFGPGLSEDLGTPMTQIEPGRWQWISPEPTKGARITIWQNDIRRANSAPLDIPPGNTVEYTPEFPA
ncbi:MAG: hypothetical protein LBD01_04635 [Puniceicoccales bacterium]|jgi:hypothetical protein|nr:hypothetical protein [Puniceicoccales bacterium]